MRRVQFDLTAASEHSLSLALTRACPAKTRISHRWFCRLVSKTDLCEVYADSSQVTCCGATSARSYIKISTASTADFTRSDQASSARGCYWIGRVEWKNCENYEDFTAYGRICWRCVVFGTNCPSCRNAASLFLGCKNIARDHGGNSGSDFLELIEEKLLHDEKHG